jgi:hypothetical protein
MINETLFTEKQRFKHRWLCLILLGPAVLAGYGVITQVVFGNQFGNKPSNNLELLLVSGLTLLITISITFLIISLSLETLISKDGIYVKFFPFHFSFRYYPWEHVHKSYVRQYKPIQEYGGWGLRGLGKNKAFSVSGNQGLQLELEENRRLLIGTKKPNEIIETLRKI